MHLAAPRHIRTRPPFPSQLLPAAPHAIRITAKPPTITPKKHTHPASRPNACPRLYIAPHIMPAPPSSSAQHHHHHHPNFLTTVLNPPAPAPTFSATQRSLQARNKAYNNTNTNYHHGAAAAAEAESYEARQRREEAGRILEREEMLIWWSQARNESVPQTRTHFRNIVLGIEERADVVWREEWELEKDAVGASPRGKERERDKGKRRVVSGTRE
ncbi:hypothetical protein HBH92_139020 [Parastagonospora nodorum]|nr:hypothetical protein HBH92_139020 [Parastagonospora nodorum]KAH4419519.1 hypothetical protein HBH93_206980 [Parastagonospora nodorum]KAH4433753.1 hypothetical protein HBH91_215300 [Parastagonospora nodorum]KAH4490158.1 hypothetical protein HBH89_183220 [Parastagonospora nodorum]KAH4528468.1 hypothetical protein HBH85_206110 [Parastagonospora nodorum]